VVIFRLLLRELGQLLLGFQLSDSADLRMSITSPSRAVLLGPGANLITSRAFLLLCAWGTGATVALAVAVAAGRTDLGDQRARAAITAIFSPPQSPDQQMSGQMSALSVEFDKQTRRHADLIRTLTEQRDSLADRQGLLEHQIRELGATLAQTTARLEGETRLAQQAAAAAAAASSKAMQPKSDLPESAPPMAAAPAPAVAPPPPAVAPPPPSPVGRTPMPQTANTLPPGQIHPAVPPPTVGFAVTSGSTLAPAPTYTGAIASPAAADANGTLTAVHPFPGQPPHPVAAADPWSAALTHRNGVKASPASVPIPAAFRSNPLMMTGIFAMPVESGASTAEFAIDLGAAPTIEALRARWNELRISQSPLLDNLKPLIALKDGSKSGQELHLVAGPLTNNSAAHRLCAVLVGTSALCQPTMYEGQRLVAR